jgi:hypothetical protein
MEDALTKNAIPDIVNHIKVVDPILQGFDLLIYLIFFEVVSTPSKIEEKDININFSHRFFFFMLK